MPSRHTAAPSSGKADDTGFRLFTDKLAVESASGQQWPGGSGMVNHVYAHGQQPSETEASAQGLDIASLAELARLLPIPASTRQWLAAKAPTAEWLAVDDAPGNWPTRPRLVLTDFKQGFTDEDAGRMRRMLDAFRAGAGQAGA